MDARVVVLAFPADVGGGASGDVDPMEARASFAALGDRVGILVSVDDRSTCANTGGILKIGMANSRRM